MPDQLLVCGIGDLCRTWMVSYLLYESKWFPWSSRISFIPFRNFRGSLFHKPVTCQEPLSFLSLLQQTLTFIAISEHLFMNIPLIFFRYKVTVLLLTFISYTCYHLARKAISVVKPKLVECPDDDNNTIPRQNETCTSWISKSCFIMYIYGVPH